MEIKSDEYEFWSHTNFAIWQLNFMNEFYVDSKKLTIVSQSNTPAASGSRIESSSGVILTLF